MNNAQVLDTASLSHVPSPLEKAVEEAVSCKL